MKKLLLLLVIALSTTAMGADIAFYVGGWNPGWYDATQFDDVAIIIDEAGHNFKDIQEFDDSANGFAAFTAWIEENTDDGELDIIWLNGTMPSVLYQFPNVDPDGSPAETWLDNGNMLLNVGDWFGYMSYEGGSRSADNGGAGAANILDLAAGIFVGGPQGTMEITAAGTEYLPSLTAVASDRPMVLSQVQAPWEVAEIFAQNAAGSHADPIVIRNTETNGYLAIVNQNAGGGWLTSRGLTCAELINNWVGPIVGLGDPSLASPLMPDDGVIDVPRDVDLAWAPGESAVTHDVYFGTSAEDVNAATTPDSAGQSGTSYDPGRLELGQTYYWRVDEVNGAPDRTVFKGNVWSFEVEPVGYPIANVTATASSSNTDAMGPEKTVDGSGLNELDQHSTMATDMWLSGVGDPNPSIQYEFDMTYKLHQLIVWNSNQLIESFVGLGAKDVVVETSIDGAEWIVVEGATLFNQATGTADYTANTIIDFGGVMAQFVRITINAGWGFMPQYGISEVRFSYIPTFAREPQPADGSTTGGVAVQLGWRAGREAATHEVYLGTDSADLPLLDTVTDNSLDLSNQGLAYATTYFWMVKEVNEAGTPTSYDGPVWSFTTPDFGTVEDFDQYNDKCNRIFFAWEDGLGHNGGEEVEDCEVPASNGNGGGSIVGNDQAPFAERTIVNAGSVQSMPFNYDNSYGDSYATLAIDNQDWTASGVQTLALAFSGEAGNTGTLYVKINNTKVLYDRDSADIARSGWQAWNIDLTALSGLGNVTSLQIGVDGGNAAGMLYIDDIRLYPLAGELITPADPGTDGLVALYSFEGNANDSSGNGFNGTVEGGAQFVAGKVGSALDCPGFDGFVSTTFTASDLGIDGNKPRTVTCWAFTRDFANGGLYDVGNRANGEDFSLRTLGSTENRWRIQYWGGDNDFTHDTVDKWVHFTHVHDGTHTKIYADGMLIVDWEKTIDTKDNNPWQIGRYGWPDAYYNGLIDELHLYDRALSAEEALFMAGRSEPIHKPF